MITVVDYGVSGLKSVLGALALAGITSALVADPDEVRRATRVLMPGVGDFEAGARALEVSGLGAAVQEVARSGRPVMGICLGLQLLYGSTDETAAVRGLDILEGRVTRFADTLPVPHVGWAATTLTPGGRAHPVGAMAAPRGFDSYYYVHSYHPAGLAADQVLATADHGGPFPALVGRDNVLGAQFHPEKSGASGSRLLTAFAEWRV